MAIALVQNVDFTSLGGFSVAATGSHHLLTLLFHISPNTTVVTSISDNASGGSNTWVQVPGTVTSSGTTGDTLQIWYCADSKAGTTVVTPTYSGGGTPLIEFGEWSGTNLISPVVDGQIASGSGTNKKAPVLTATVGNELFVVGLSDTSANPTGIGSPWVLFHPANPFRGAYMLNPGAAGTYTPQWSPDQTDFYIADGAVFAAASTGPTPAVASGMFLVF
jgi:hypothetical protein